MSYCLYTDHQQDSSGQADMLRYCTSLKSTVLVDIIPSNIYHHKYIHPTFH